MPDLAQPTTDPSQLRLDHRIDVDSFTGSATVGIPLHLSSGRGGFGPRLALDYDSSAANSPFGLGWSLAGLLSISVATRKRLPHYDPSDDFTLNICGELVPALAAAGGSGQPLVDDRGAFWVRHYRPRVEQQFLRIEQWIEKATQRVHWRTRDGRDVLTVYGLRDDGSSRIADPADPSRTFTWLADAQYDPRGNAIRFSYLGEDRAGVDRSSTFEEAHRGALAQRYLKRIAYGNTRPVRPDADEPAGNRWAFEVVFDYGDHDDAVIPSATPNRTWPARPDAFSSYRPGFDVRTYRLCRRVLQFHRFPDLGSDAVPVAAYGLDHAADPAGCTLLSVAYTGYRGEGRVTAQKSLPPLAMTYSAPAPASAFVAASPDALVNVPGGLGDGFRWVDLYGEGLPGILSEGGAAWYFKANEGGGSFGAQEVVVARPACSVADCVFNDFDADGNTDVAVMHGRDAGYFRFDRDAGVWDAFRPFPTLPHLEGAGPSAQWIDLDGDGRTDLVLADQERIVWFANRGDEGFAAPQELARPGAGSLAPLTEDLALDFFFADMTGDGLMDQVRVRNGRVEYWPQLGNGRFGDAVLMDGAPQFADDFCFDARRVLLVDLDGTGTADIVYVGTGEVSYWLNAAGNRLVEGGRLGGLPYIDDLSTLQVLDFLGDGTPCLVWSSPLVESAHAIQYLPLTDGITPRLLLSVDNGMGLRQEVDYASSATHYLRDRREGRPWRTRLPSHHSVVDRKTISDLIGGRRTVTRYAYHDGCYDGERRAFGGFGAVDCYEGEVAAGSASPADSLTTGVCLRTWFHQGRLLRGPLPEAYAGDPQAMLVAAQGFEEPDGLSAAEYADGLRALSGLVLRQESFALAADGTRAADPFEASQHGYLIRRLQPAHGGRDASFLAYAAESVTTTYEQQADDPRVTHDLTLAIDELGNVTRECSLAYPRRAGIATDAPAQGAFVATLRDHGFANVATADRYEGGIPVETREFEMAGLTPASSGMVDRTQLAHDVAAAVAAPLRFDQSFTSGLQLRLIGHMRFLYWNDARDAALPAGQVGAPALLHHAQTAVFTPQWASATYGAHVDQAALQAAAYTLEDGYWWKTSDVGSHLGSDGFFQLASSARPDGGTTTFAYDADHLSVVEIHDAVGNVTQIDTDHHALAPRRTVDPNGNVNELLYDPLRVVVASSLSGQLADDAGNAHPFGNEPLAGYGAPSGATFDSVLADPASYLQSAGQATFYDLDAWTARGAPPCTVKLARERYLHDGTGAAPQPGRIAVAVSHADGFGNVLQDKVLSGPGPAILRGSDGSLQLDAQGRPKQGPASTRWLASGHTVFNRTQQPVRQYEPFYSTTAAYEGEDALAHFGVYRQLRYDGVGRLVREDFPNGSFAKTEYRPWELRSYDPDDTVQDSDYRTAREGLPASDPEKKTLVKAQAHADTPTVARLDSLGREIGRVTSAAPGDERTTQASLDVRGRTLAITDQRGLTTFSHKLDMLGREHFTHSADGGDVWLLVDAYDRTAQLWNGRGFHQQRRYDRLDRLVSLAVDDVVLEQIVYGDDPSAQQPELNNLRGRAMLHRDEAGTESAVRYDPSGNALRVERQLCVDYKHRPDWRHPAAIALEQTAHVTTTSYDALGRVLSLGLPDGSTQRMSYLAGGGLAGISIATADGKVSDTDVLGSCEYNARGARARGLLGNGVEVARSFDPKTFLTTRLTARRPGGSGAGTLLQDLRYTYDPVGNITFAVDHAQDPGGSGAVIQGLGVSPSAEYTYDALYQLVAATGRVHKALLQGDGRPGAAGTTKGTRRLGLNDGAAVERYTRAYGYDHAGNVTRIRHTGTSHSWTSDMWVSSTSNRALPALDSNGQPVSDPESHFDACGNTTFLPHLRTLDWDHSNRLSHAVVIDRSADGQPDDAEYYIYDGNGSRMRKVTERLVANGVVEVTDTRYLGGCEIRQVRRDTTVLLERMTTRVSDGTSLIALVHRWTTDTKARETDDVTQARLRYQLTNHLGSAALELDEAAAVISYEEYFPYGGSAFIAGDRLREVAMRDYRFCGRERDDATGFLYVVNRYYASWLGRWLSADPVGPDSDINQYRYVRNDPVNLFDPDGLQTRQRHHHQRGHRYDVRGPTVPQVVIDAWRARSPERQRHLLQEHFDWLAFKQDGKVQVVFGTPAEIRRRVERLLREGHNVGRFHLVRRHHGSRHHHGRHHRGHGGAEHHHHHHAAHHHHHYAAHHAGHHAGHSHGAGTASHAHAHAGPEHGDDGTGGGAHDAGGTPAGSTGSSSSGDPGATAVHAGDGESTHATPAAHSGGAGGTGTGPGSGTKGSGHGGGGTDEHGTPGAHGDAGRGHPGTGSGAHAGTGSHSGDGGDQGHGDDGGNTARGEDGGVAEGTGTTPGARHHPDSSLPPSDGVTPPPPGQTVNGTDPHGSPHGALHGVRANQGHHDGTSSSGTGVGSGASHNGTHPHHRHGQHHGDGAGQHRHHQKRTFGDRVIKYFGYLNLEFSGGDPNKGQSGGIPGGHGTHNWGGWGQALYAALTVVSLILMFAGGGEIKALFTSIRAGLRAVGEAIVKVFTRDFWEDVGTKIIEAIQNRIWARVTWTRGVMPKGVMGVTDWFGNIVIDQNLVGKDMLETVLHEGVHSALSPKAFLAEARGRLSMWFYNNSTLGRFLEEFAAETVGTGSARKAFNLVMSSYDIGVGRLLAEGAAYLGLVGGGAYAGYRAADATQRPSHHPQPATRSTTP